MGAADIILDLVSTGVTLRENNLKELLGGNILAVRCQFLLPQHSGSMCKGTWSSAHVALHLKSWVELASPSDEGRCTRH